VEIKIGSGVENREIVGETEIFDSAVIGKVFCWSKVIGASEPTQVKHLWYLGDKLINEITLDIKYPAHRTWSVKTITPELKGAWKVEVVDSEGKMLGFKTFSVQ
jgi:hypothetical protein